jgi:hypothetical protein
MLRSTIAPAALAAALLLLIPGGLAPAGAQVSVNIDIGIGANLSGGRRISCAEGERILRQRGFFNIRRVDCRGRYLVYRGTRRGWRHEISLSSFNGRVVDYRRLRRV